MAHKPGRRGRRVNATGRSIGSGHHVRFYRWELDSPAYRSLSIGARALLVELKALYMGSNNGALFLSVRRAAEKLNSSRGFAAARVSRTPRPRLHSPERNRRLQREVPCREWPRDELDPDRVSDQRRARSRHERFHALAAT
jgi:hypothetical protein